MNDLAHDLIRDFYDVAVLANVPLEMNDLQFVHNPAPHRPPSRLPLGCQAVYSFHFGETCLKVGKVGPRSHARYSSQHYGFRAPSTLAKSLVAQQTRIGLAGLDMASAGSWILANTCRLDFWLPSRTGIAALSLLEAFLHCRLKPAFEGFASQRDEIVRSI